MTHLNSDLTECIDLKEELYGSPKSYMNGENINTVLFKILWGSQQDEMRAPVYFIFFLDYTLRNYKQTCEDTAH